MVYFLTIGYINRAKNMKQISLLAEPAVIIKGMHRHKENLLIYRILRPGFSCIQLLANP